MRYAPLLLAVLAACDRSVTPPVPQPVDRAGRAREAREVARRHLGSPAPVMTLAAERVEDFFAVRFARVDGAVAELFGWKGKWRATFWSRDDYEAYVRRTFERRLLRPADFD